MKSKKILIIVIIIIAILFIIGGGVLAYLFIATDTFKGDKELFSKYISQNIETVEKIGNSQIIETYKNLNDKEKYESNTVVKAVYSEGGEVSNPMNNLAAKLDIQRNNNEQYFYIDGQILFNDEEYMESEIINDKELYGIRFSDVAKQFISVKEDSNLDNVANDIGIDTATLQNIINIINGTNTVTEELATEDEIKSLKDKYFNMIVTTITNGTFSSNKKAMITYNNNTVATKAYTVSLTSEQVENLIIQILNSLKTETIITNNLKDNSFEEKIDEQIKTLTEEKEVPTVKITVYEQKQNTIRTVIEVGNYKILLENSEENEQIKSNIKINNTTSEQSEEYNIDLIKETKEGQEDITVDANVVKGEQNYNLSFVTEFVSTDQDLKLNTTVSYKKDILTASIKLENNIDFTNDFSKKVSLENANNVTLNNIEEEKRKNIIGVLKENVPLKFKKRIELLKQQLEIKEEKKEEEIPDYEMSQVEINKFNAKFEFYTGDEVSAENVKALLNIVCEHLGSYEIKLAEDQENTSSIREEDLRYVINLNIERNKKDEEGIKKILEKIKKDGKYKISISYKGENQLIDYIKIEEIKK